MRPLRLTMQAFGPYAGRETIDFREVIDGGIFGIYGPTGSGKSSIFNAMSFALFGESAKGNQDPATLRSHHARNDCLTEVEFVFEIGAKRYLIRRWPEQMRKSVRGGGETREKHAACFFDATGIELDKLTNENNGKIIAERKLSDVKEELSKRLGYGAEQFRQIVLLPQGKFETFLTANTRDRLTILRELFDVSLFKRLAQKMKEDAKILKDNIRNDRELCSRLLLQEDFDTFEILSEAIKGAASELNESRINVKKMQKKAVEAEKTLAQATQTEKSFVDNTEARANLKMIKDKLPEIEDDRARLAGARCARTLVDVDETVRMKQGEAKTAADEKDNAVIARANAEAITKLAGQKLLQEQGKHQELENLRQHLDALKRHRVTLEEAKGLEEARKMAEKNAVGTEKAYKITQSENASLVQLRTEKITALKTARQTTEEYTRLSEQMRALKDTLHISREHEKAATLVSDSERRIIDAQKRHEIKINGFEKARIKYERSETALADAQAIHLAEKLLPGHPCPVCGSKDHPSSAQGHAESAGLDAAFRQARKMLEEAKNAETEANRMLSNAEAILLERKNALELKMKPDDSVISLNSQKATLDDGIQALGPISEPTVLQGELETIEKQITKATDKDEAARSKRDKDTINVAVAVKALETALVSIPEYLQDTSILETAIKKENSDIAQREEAMKNAVQAERDAGESLIGARKDEENALGKHEKAIEDIGKSQAIFKKRLVRNNLTFDQYQTHKINIPRIDKLNETVNAYDKNLASAKDRAARAKAAIKDRHRPDIREIISFRNKASDAKDEAIDNAAQKKARAGELKRLETSIINLRKEISKAEKAYAPLGNIADAFNGLNEARMELETFAIAAMFDRVLISANLRLGPMTTGRYTLVREQNVVKGAARRGLGISVHDIHTGRSRSTSTLSGGETFMAALSLALGLADVVESVSGGIRLDTIFIDEGFGGLDPTTLDQALQTLQDRVGENRAVGLISHVELVQQTIPNGFHITPSIDGSHIAAIGCQIP